MIKLKDKSEKSQTSDIPTPPPIEEITPQESPREEKDVKNSKEKKGKKEKKIKSKVESNRGDGTLWAKVVVGAILAFTIILSLMKLIDYLDKPKTLFYSVVDSTYNDFSNLMNNLNTLDLYKIILSETSEVDAKVDLKTSNLKGDYSGLESKIDALDYSALMRIDRPSEYMSIQVSAKSNDEEKFNIDIIDDAYKMTYNVPKIFEKFIELDSREVNLEAIDPSKSLIIGEIIKQESMKMFMDQNFISKEEAIAVNGRAIDCKKSSYEFKGSEFMNLIDDIIATIKQNNVAYSYLTSIYGQNVDNKIQKFKTDLNIDANSTYRISAYTKLTTQEAVRLEILNLADGNGEVSEKGIIYSKDVNYQSLVYSFGNSIESIEIKGNLASSFDLTLKGEDDTITFTRQKNSNMVNGNLTVIETGSMRMLFNATFDYTLNSQSQTTHSLVANLGLETYKNNERTSYNMDIEALINTNVSIRKESTGSTQKYSLMTDAEKEKLHKDFADLLKNIDLRPPSSTEGEETTPPNESETPTDPSGSINDIQNGVPE